MKIIKKYGGGGGIIGGIVDGVSHAVSSVGDTVDHALNVTGTAVDNTLKNIDATKLAKSAVLAAATGGASELVDGASFLADAGDAGDFVSFASDVPEVDPAFIPSDADVLSTGTDVPGVVAETGLEEPPMNDLGEITGTTGFDPNAPPVSGTGIKLPGTKKTGTGIKVPGTTGTGTSTDNTDLVSILKGAGGSISDFITKNPGLSLGAALLAMNAASQKSYGPGTALQMTRKVAPGTTTTPSVLSRGPLNMMGTAKLGAIPTGVPAPAASTVGMARGGYVGGPLMMKNKIRNGGML